VEIKRFLSDMTMMQEEALARIAQQARGSMGDFLSTDDNGGIRFDLGQAKKAGAMDLVQQVRIRPVAGLDGVVRQQGGPVPKTEDQAMRNPGGTLTQNG
jgi:hypothetical protein